MKEHRLRPLFAAAILVTALAAAAEAAAYRFSVVPEQSKDKMEAKWGPLLKYLSDKTGSKIQLELEDSYDAFYAKYEKGAYDFAVLNPRSYVLKTKEGLYKAFARQDAKLQGIVVVPKSSPAQSLEDLAGKKIIYPSPDSYAATILVQAGLKAAGVEPAGEPLFAGGHDKAYQAVVEGKADAAAGVMRTFIQLKPEAAAELRILYTTAPALTHPFVANKRVPERVVSSLQQALVQMSDDPAALALLKGVGMSPLRATSDKEYDELRAPK